MLIVNSFQYLLTYLNIKYFYSSAYDDDYYGDYDETAPQVKMSWHDMRISCEM